MEDVSEDGDAVCEAWAGTGEVAVGVDGEDAAIANRGQIAPGFGRVECAPLGGGAVGIVATGHDKDDLGTRLCDLLGGDFERWLPCYAEDVFAASFGDHFGNPMAPDVKGGEPFKAEDTRADRRSRCLHFDRGDLLLYSERKRLRVTTTVRGFANASNIFPDINQRMRRERKDARTFREAGERSAEIVRRNGANVAEVLRDDQVRREFCEQVGIDGVDAFAASSHIAHLAIHFAGRNVEIQARMDECRLLRGGRREVAFVRHTSNGITEAEGIKDFRGGG